MSETDPRGYYTCLGLRPWATAADIRAAYHRCAKQWHPDVDPRPEAKARFQAITEAYRILINPAERAIYDRSAGADRSQSGAASLQPVFVTLPELSIRSLSLGNSRVATLLLFGVLGLAAVLLSEMFPGAEERLPSSLPPPTAASASLEDALSKALALAPVQVHQDDAAGSARPPNLSPSPGLPRPAKNEASPISGAWLFRDLPNQKPPINLLTREEARETQRHLIERGYLVGQADGLWGPRSQAALEDFRRAQGLVSDDGSTSETQSAPPSQAAQASEKPGLLEQVFPPERPAELSNPPGAEVNNPTGEIANVTPERRPSGQSQQIGASETYVGSWAPSRAACASAEVPPLAISAQRASSFGGLAGGCEFGEVRREDDGWRTRAQCFADGKRWTANVHLRATGSTLMWSSERGRATYYRCG